MDMTLDEIASIVGGTVEGDAALRIRGLNGLKEAQPGDISFYADPRYQPDLDTTRAAALIVDAAFADGRRPLIRVVNPYFAFAQLLKHMESLLLVHPTGIHPSAAVASTAVLGEGVALDAHVCVASGARIGARTVLYAGVYIGRDASIGPDCVLYPHVSIRERVTLGARGIIHANSTLGTDGFGYTAVGGRPVKIPQIGSVIVGDDVEIGSNTSIDRATTGNTTIGSGTKIDNLVQIGHNVSIGENCTISGSTGISGSTIIGNNVTIGGQVGTAGHLKIGDHARIGARTGVNKSVPAKSVVSGHPMHDHDVTRRILASLEYLPDALRRLRKLEKRVQNLGQSLDEQATDD
jgi:UDP-3-O-[3-hydroxymyristoyl] glucosamine N-acyltransferase